MDDQPTPAEQPETPAHMTETETATTAVRPRRTRRLMATFAASALVVGVGGAGAGYAVGRSSGGDASTTSANGSPSSTDQSGTQSAPGSGWTWSDGGGASGDSQGDGSGSLPTSPYGGSDGGGFSGGGGYDGGSGQGQATDTTKAKASQITGLVRVATTLKYQQASAAGTGMVLTSDGEVVTNHHVVAGATSIKVTVMSTGTSYVAKVVGTDAKDDVAVLQLTGASGLTTITPDEDPVSVGDAVTAVGDANGTVGYLSAATGKVVGLKQSITTEAEGSAASERLTGMIKVDADVISGDSGGATYDSEGEVLGMTTAASSGSTNVVGFAVPIAKVERIADDLESGVTRANYTYGSPAFLGIALGATTTIVQGVYADTPAAKAGITTGARITKVGSTTVTTEKQLHNAIAALSPGDSTSVTWTDATGSRTASVTLATGPVA